ncbi:hypothetical protein BC629DRAFT_1593287 [Irpex lacteus]|nr:hypothetical protein BC629DRAFT_1593287 [Irpex lacteus]
MPSPLDQVKTAILQNHINISTLGILVYEYIALVRSKAKSIWRRRNTAVSILFLWNRYVSLMYGVLGVLEMSTLTPKRWYLYTIVTPTVLGSPKAICVLTSTMFIPSRMVTASRTTSVFSERLVLVLTCIKTLGNVRTARAVGMSTSMSVSEVLVKNGALYFLVFLLLNIVPTVIQETTGIEYLSPYIFAITSTLITRFLLNLRQVDNPSSYAVSTYSDTGSVVFDRHRTPRTEGSTNNGRDNLVYTDTEARSREAGPRMSSLSRFVETMGADLEFGDDEADEDSRIGPRD